MGTNRNRFEGRARAKEGSLSTDKQKGGVLEKKNENV